MKPISDVAKNLPTRAEIDRLFQPVKPVACDLCGDVGYIRGDYPAGHTLFGRLFPCPKCNQRASAQPDEYGLLPAERGMAWTDIVPVDPTIVAAMTEIQKTLAAGFGWVYLWGGYGTAKTTLLKIAVAEHLRSVNSQAVYLRMADLMDDIRSAYDTNHPNYEIQRKIRWYSGLPLLAIDEFEKVNATDFVDERRFQVMDSRYEAATRQGHGVTLIAANVPPEKMPGAIKSRINDQRFSVCHITSSDVRLVARDLLK